MQKAKSLKNKVKETLQKNSYPHIVDKVVNKKNMAQHIVYKLIFAGIVLNLNINFAWDTPADCLDLSKYINYNCLAYVLMEFREHAIL